jgi:uncharacterized protein (DUF1015 family)
MRIKPFQALRPPAELAPRVASLPYDVVDTAEARKLSEGNPYSFFRVSRAEIALPDGTDLYSEAVYRKAAEVFREFQDQGVLAKDPGPALYLYRLIRQGHAQIGLITVCHVEDYERDLIKKHEKTRQAPEDDRTKHIFMTKSHSGPVFLLYRDNADIDALASAVAKTSPLYDLTAPDGIQHTIWRIADADAWVRAFGKIPQAYIADGHHRAAAAARVARERKAANSRHTGNEEYNWFQAVLFPASQLRILPYNRCVKDLNGLSGERFLELVGARFVIREQVAPLPKQPANISMYFRNRWVGLSWTLGPVANPVEALDVSVLQDRLLGPVLGIDDPRSNPRIEFVGGVRGTGELEKRVQSGRAAVAFSMYPTTVDQLMAISDAGEIMPPKSTWFEPKLRDGLIIHTLD